MNEQIIEFLQNENSYGVWMHLKNNYEGIYNDEDLKMFDKYAYFYDIPTHVMNVVMYMLIDSYDMNSSKLVSDLDVICKKIQKSKIETIREAVYFISYEISKEFVEKSIVDLSMRIDKLESSLK
jgi:hypothetical protein